MKKIVFASSLALIVLSLALTAAFAAYDYDKIYMVSGSNLTAEKTDPFILEQETPWLFFQFSNSLPLNYTISNSDQKVSTKWTWENPDGEAITYAKDYFITQNGVWGTLDEWPTVKQVGNWTILVGHFLSAKSGIVVPSGNYADTTKFKVSNVVPEPASALLYFLGGGSLIAGFFRKRK